MSSHICFFWNECCSDRSWIILKVMYFGSAQTRAVIRQYEFFFPKDKKNQKKKKTVKGDDKKKQSRVKFDVLLTSYEMINMDSVSLKPIQWECMVFSFWTFSSDVFCISLCWYSLFDIDSWWGPPSQEQRLKIISSTTTLLYQSSCAFDWHSSSGWYALSIRLSAFAR